ncbi:hypothetical protein DAPPUDRAFT_95280 [Daphnia pulex]|uniref:Uncharacterized protein n=1 Tax=Daphnia pulex TaxID=6669 RepID=E9FV76_DAPPU|nr:hypothetical protein DAPPUDRAFT_95280 [Daphnia pulex]|eukprot:EFX88509.1 hypothetical protein DAPPUDRAFT_95280 [Daphnia pulex]
MKIKKYNWAAAFVIGRVKNKGEMNKYLQFESRASRRRFDDTHSNDFTVEYRSAKSFSLASAGSAIVSGERIDHFRFGPSRRIFAAVAAIVAPFRRVAAGLVAVQPLLQWRQRRNRRSWPRKRFLLGQPELADGHNGDWRATFSGDVVCCRRERTGLGRPDPVLPLRLVVLRGPGRLCQLGTSRRRLHHSAHAHLQMGQPDQVGGPGGGQFLGQIAPDGHQQSGQQHDGGVRLQRDWRPNVTALISLALDDDGQTVQRSVGHQPHGVGHGRRLPSQPTSKK